MELCTETMSNNSRHKNVPLLCHIHDVRRHRFYRYAENLTRAEKDNFSQ